MQEYERTQECSGGARKKKEEEFEGPGHTMPVTVLQDQLTPSAGGNDQPSLALLISLFDDGQAYRRGDNPLSVLIFFIINILFLLISGLASILPLNRSQTLFRVCFTLK